MVSILKSGKVRLAWYLPAGALVISAVSFLAAHLLTLITFGSVITGQSEALSGQLSQLVKSSIINEMREGLLRGESPKRILYHSGDHQESDTSLSIRLLSPGELSGRDNLPGSLKTFISGSDSRIFPLEAEAGCLECHHTSIGATLGYLRIDQDISSLLSGRRNLLLLTFLLLSPVPIGMAWFLSRSVTRRLSNSTRELNDRLQQARTTSDIDSYSLDNINLGFVELNQILQQLRRFMRQVKSLTIDKKILEFEIGMLERFIITSEVVRDWKSSVRTLLNEIQKVVPAQAIFTLFRVDDGRDELEIFWHGWPGEAVQLFYERALLAELTSSDHGFDAARISIQHHLGGAPSTAITIPEKGWFFQTKRLSMETPPLQGVIGLAQTGGGRTRSMLPLVVDSALTTLLNVVGSVKAIGRYTRELEYYATRDPLTNLYNQRMFWELFNYEISRGHRHEYPFTLLMIDCDNFKFVNDNYGHKFGDFFLQEMAGSMRKALRDGDILTRYGGDEFAIILPETDTAQAGVIARRLGEAVQKMNLTAPDGRRVQTTLSIGLATCPDHGREAKNLFLVADQMMYQVKRGGKNGQASPTEGDLVRICQHDEERNRLIVKILDTPDSIIPYFQPVIEVSTGRVPIHELLLRVQDGDEVVSAGEVVEAAERMGVMAKIDLLLLEKAVAVMRETSYRGLLFVNISPRSLLAESFATEVRGIVDRHGVAPKRIVFEITERDTVQNLEQISHLVRTMRNEGFRFAVDDFGSGFSSFQYIKHFSIDFLKIDGDFIVNLINSPTDQAFVKSIVTLAKELNIATIAEHIEDQETLDCIRVAGIDYAQGYYTGRPGAKLMR